MVVDEDMASSKWLLLLLLLFGVDFNTCNDPFSERFSDHDSIRNERNVKVKVFIFNSSREYFLSS